MRALLKTIEIRRGAGAALIRVVLALPIALYWWMPTAVNAAAAPCSDTKTCLRLIESRQRETRSLSAQFVQTKSLSLMNEPLVTHGSFAFKQPDQVMWKIDDPPLTIRINRQGLRIDERPEVENEVRAMASFSQLMRKLSGMFVGSLQEIEGSFDVVAGSDASEIRLQLTPKEAQLKDLFRTITVSFTTADVVMHSLRVEEALGDRLEIVFSDVHRNDSAAEAALRDETKP